jgi:hypothetical protein
MAGASTGRTKLPNCGPSRGPGAWRALARSRGPSPLLLTRAAQMGLMVPMDLMALAEPEAAAGLAPDK